MDRQCGAFRELHRPNLRPKQGPTTNGTQPQHADNEVVATDDVTDNKLLTMSTTAYCQIRVTQQKLVVSSETTFSREVPVTFLREVAKQPNAAIATMSYASFKLTLLPTPPTYGFYPALPWSRRGA